MASESGRKTVNPPIEIKVGFIGLGDMGSGMATNIARGGVSIKVRDLRPEAMEKAIAAGANAAASLSDLVRFADSVHVCLVFEEQITALITGPDGILEHAKPGTIIVVHSTLMPSTVRRYAELARARDCHLIDAAISGGSVTAGQGTSMESDAKSLTMMVGGPEDIVRKIMPVLELVATVFHVGEVGAAEAVKLANNVMNYANRVVYLEALQIAEAFGVTEEAFNQVVDRSTGMSYAQRYRERNDRRWKHHTFSREELPYRFTKDLRYALQMALDEKIQLPMTGLCAQVAPDSFRRRWARIEAKVKAAEKSGRS
jgi:3-hydroxyisobutyrate dehydrogenase-like beta-hydroxyacid dehydrogenase